LTLFDDFSGYKGYKTLWRRKFGAGKFGAENLAPENLAPENLAPDNLAPRKIWRRKIWRQKINYLKKITLKRKDGDFSRISFRIGIFYIPTQKIQVD